MTPNASTQRLNIFVAGATGALGRQLVPRLVEHGHEVTGTTRKEANRTEIEAMGAKAAIMDALDAESVGRAVSEAAPDVIVHQLTALSDMKGFRNMDKSFAMTNRLRTEGTDHLLSAGRAAGIKKFVAQSFAGWPYAKTGGPVKTEEDPLDPNPISTTRETVKAIRYVEEQVSGLDWAVGTALRYGGFYGPGTSFADANGSGEAGPHVEMIRKRQWPLVGDGAGVMSFIHIADAAEATVHAIEEDHPGIYNIVDDDPAPFSEWLPIAAEELGAKPPRHVPKWIGRLAGGEAAVVMSTELRGASNAKAKHELGWKPHFASWRQGFAEGLR